jgi:hypothetical protein
MAKAIYFQLQTTWYLPSVLTQWVNVTRLFYAWLCCFCTEWATKHDLNGSEASHFPNVMSFLTQIPQWVMAQAHHSHLSTCTFPTADSQQGHSWHSFLMAWYEPHTSPPPNALTCHNSSNFPYDIFLSSPALNRLSHLKMEAHVPLKCLNINLLHGANTQ